MPIAEVHAEYGELHEFPNGRVYYRDEDHSYWLAKDDGARGKRIASVSTLVAPYSGDPEFLMNWAAGLTLEGVSTLFAGESVPDTPDVLAERLNEHEMTWSHLREQAADRGTLVHEYFEAMAGVRPYPSLDDASDRELGMFKALEDWWEQAQPEVEQAEQVVFSSKHKYAGRFDLRFKQAQSKGVLWNEPMIRLCDLKTSKRVYPKYLVQLQGYDLAADECGIGDSDDQFILQVDENGGWREVICSDDFIAIVKSDGEERILEIAPPDHKDFIKAVDIYRQATQLQKVA